MNMLWRLAGAQGKRTGATRYITLIADLDAASELGVPFDCELVVDTHGWVLVDMSRPIADILNEVYENS